VSTSSASLRERAPLPEGTIPVGGALLIAGFATYAFFKVGNVAVGGPEAFAPIAALWFATFALAPGFFLPLEQELGRALAHRRAIKEGGRPVVGKVTSLSMVLVAIVVVVIALASPILTTAYFDGDWVMVIALAVAFAAYAPAHLARGICGGSGRFNNYAIIMGSDGVVRITLCVALAIIGIDSAGAYGMAVAIAPLFGVTYVWRRRGLRTEPGPPAEWSEVTPNLGWLLLGSVFAASLLNAGPIAASLLADDSQEALVTEFSYGILLARVPLFLFQAVQAALLPRLSRLAATQAYVEFKSGLVKVLAMVLAVGIAGAIGALILGPFAIELVYDAELGGGTLAVLAVASAIYMGALATAQAVIALHGHPLVSLGWGVGLATFLVVTWLSSDELFERIEWGLLTSSIAALIVFALALRHRLRAGAAPDADSLLEAITDRPLEY
jgi:O-antigen/teichoic acid export membrane protein